MPHTMPWTTPRNTPGRRIHLPATLLATWALLAAPACTKRSNGAGGGDATTDDDAADTNTDDAWFETGNATSSGTSDDGSGESTGDDGEPCDAWLGCPDTPGTIDSCDFWAQDCPEGEKCTFAATTPGGGTWDANICVPAGTEPPGAPCMTIAGGLNGEDTCDASSMCYDFDDTTGIGTCMEFCVGDPDNNSCPQTGTQCMQLAGGVLNICPVGCDPLLAGECPRGQTCIPTYEGDLPVSFFCFPPAAQGGQGEACTCLNCCANGFMCTQDENYGPGCTENNCCTELCDVTDTTFTCADQVQQCVALFDPTDPYYAHIGACLVP